METDSNKFFNSGISPMSVAVPVFDWENADWMPTPPGQSQISLPWIGQGSLASAYGIDVINDIKAADGWVLLYNTFSASAPGHLVNPYFILYNKYRGLMRIYLYVTTQFVATSTYLQDGISIVSNQSTSLLNFLGKDFVDATVNTKMYSQMQPAPVDGSMPLASNKWYMLQYEMAYDPNISQIPYNHIQLSWYLNYYNVDSVKLGGKFEGKLNGTIGSATSTASNFFSALGVFGEKVGTGALAIVGKNFLTNNTVNETSGENTLGLPNGVFKQLVTGVNNAISSAVGGLPGAAISLLSAIIGGSSNAGPTPICLNIKADIDLRGSQTSAGSFPSSPTSFWVPGTNISSSAVGYIPAYNYPLGVINFNGKPTITINYTCNEINGKDAGDEYEVDFPETINYSNNLLINPEVLSVANVNIIRQDLIFTGRKGNADFMEINPCAKYIFDQQNKLMPDVLGDSLTLGVRFTIKIEPNDGSPSSVIIKTFLLNHVWNLIN
ncbi:MAG: hypothetical protein LBE11_05970 [Prevotellaceae bacterium]|nr:hypothetical protein [Prevotellaceae bacterium]